MKHLQGVLKFYEDEDCTIDIDEPYYQLKGGRRVMMKHVFIAECRDPDAQHKAVEKAAKMSIGQVVSIDNGDDCYHFCNEDNIFKPGK